LLNNHNSAEQPQLCLRNCAHASNRRAGKIEFFPLGERVRMVITLHPMHNEEFTKMSAEGFTSQLTKLDRRFGART